MTIYASQIEMGTVVCCNCGMTFGMPADYQKQRHEDRKNFFCPSGHQQHYTGPNEETRLKAELERQKQYLEAEQARTLRVTRERDTVARAHTKMRTRVMNGVCPCCNRTFQNLLRHMQTEHAGDLNLRALRTAYGMTQSAVAQEIGITNVHVSNHERGRPVPEHAERAIEAWMAAQEPAIPAPAGRTPKLKEPK